MVPILILAIAAPRSSSPRLQWAVVAGLGCSVIGDFLLMLPHDLFLAGLLAFLLAHLCYLLAFSANCPVPARWRPFLLWAAFGAAVLAVLWTKIPPDLRVPVLVYTGVLLAMVAQANGRALRLWTRNSLVLAAGATLFLLSDTLLALNRFGYPMPASRVLVLAPYFTAQWMISISLSLRVPNSND